MHAFIYFFGGVDGACPLAKALVTAQDKAYLPMQKNG